jgi:hypothetical protein
MKFTRALTHAHIYTQTHTYEGEISYSSMKFLPSFMNFSQLIPEIWKGGVRLHRLNVKVRKTFYMEEI